MINESRLSELKNDVIISARILVHRGLCEAFGHVSARVPQTDLFIITPKSSMAFIRAPSDLVVVNLKGDTVRGTQRPPLETWIHTCIYNPSIIAEKILAVLPEPIHLRRRYSAYWVSR
jgi:ribulose-5-phosphate 4-epimerase/fuculose-1-phosphate aldolase